MGRVTEGCSAYISANGMYGACPNGFPQAPGCRRDNSGFWRPYLDEEWCGRWYEKTGGAPPGRAAVAKEG